MCSGGNSSQWTCFPTSDNGQRQGHAFVILLVHVVVFDVPDCSPHRIAEMQDDCVFSLRFHVLSVMLMLMLMLTIQIQIQIRQRKQVATQTSTAPQGELTTRKNHTTHGLDPRDHEARPHSVLVPSASTLTRDTAASAPPFHTQTKKSEFCDGPGVGCTGA